MGSFLLFSRQHYFSCTVTSPKVSPSRVRENNIGFSLGAAQGALSAVARAAELLSLGLSVTTALVSGGTSKRRAFTLSSLFGLFAVGSLGGYTLLSGLSGAALEVLLSFAAALLYLVTEELLTEAHEVPETPLTTAMFFVGFLFIMVIDMLA